MNDLSGGGPRDISAATAPTRANLGLTGEGGGDGYPQLVENWFDSFWSGLTGIISVTLFTRASTNYC